MCCLIKMKRQTKKTTVDLDTVFYADDRWMRLMSNRNYFKEFMTVILKQCNLKGNGHFQSVRYRGNFFYAADEDITPLIDEETHDIIVRHADEFQEVAGQRIYEDPVWYLNDHAPIQDCMNIYFVGDVHGDGEGNENGDFDVHWNCFIIKRAPNPSEEWVMWYDPAFSTTHVMTNNYNFDQRKKEKVLEAIYRIIGRQVAVNTITPIKEAQVVCNPSYDYVDSFCQTWVMMFAAAVVDGRMNDFLDLPFAKYGALILKTWVYCLVTHENMNAWAKELKTKTLKPFKYARLRSPHNAMEVKLVEIDTVSKLPTQTCMDAVIAHFSGI